MAIASQLERLQLGAAGSRHRVSKRLGDAPTVYANAFSISLQRSSIRKALLPSLHCSKNRVFSLAEDDPDRLTQPSPVFQVAFAHEKNLLVAVDEEGVVCITDPSSPARKNRWQAHHNAIFDVIWTHDDTQVMSAAGDLQIRIWDVETAGKTRWTSTTPVATLRGHDMSVKCVRQSPDNAHVFASGGRDGRVLLWDTRATGKPVASLDGLHAEPSPSRSSSPGVSFSSPEQKRRRRGGAIKVSSSPRSVTCVEFGVNGNELITAGAVDAVVKYWDVRRFKSGSGQGKKKTSSPTPIRQFSCSTREGARRGISSLELRQGGAAGTSYLLVNVLNDAITLVDVGRRQHRDGYHEPRTLLRCSGHRSSSFYSKATFSPDGDFIAGASADGVVYVWDACVGSSSRATLQSAWSSADVELRSPCLALKGHMSEVNGVAWNCQDFTQLSTCSDDGTVRSWQIESSLDLATRVPAGFELLQAPSTGESEASRGPEWANWSAFLKQPDGFAYCVCAAEKLALDSRERVDPPLSSSRQRLPPTQGSPLDVARRTDEPRLHPVHVAPGAQLHPQPHEDKAHQKCPIRLQRKAKPATTSNRAQRTLLDLWGKQRAPTTTTRAQRTLLELWGK